MGYTTTFKGELKFANEPTAPQLAKLKKIFCEDCREHPEWAAPGLNYVDLELNDDFTAIRHDGSEKTYELEHIVNLVIRLMRSDWPEFGLTGSMLAQGEDPEDRWSLTIGENGQAMKVEITITGSICTCPECGHRFEVAVQS